MLHSLGVGDALLSEPIVQLLKRLHLRLWAEQHVAHRADLVLGLALLPARGRRAGDRIHQMMRAKPEETPVISAGAAEGDDLHRRAHIVVNPAPADPTIKAKARSCASNTISCVSRK